LVAKDQAGAAAELAAEIEQRASSRGFHLHASFAKRLAAICSSPPRTEALARGVFATG
jgi:hypothetical protein